MKIYCTGSARIRHNVTGEFYEIESDELDWDAVSGDERHMGSEIHKEAVIDNPELGKLTWGLWEYPVGIENKSETGVGPHKAVEDFDYGLEHGPPEPDEWVDYTVPYNPFTIFMNSYNHSGDLLADHGRDGGDQLLNRMVFSHQVAALEAYLGDTLINEVMGDSTAMQRLIGKDEDLVKAKFTLAEISNDAGLVKRAVREHLRSILYHNLAKVDVLYNIALGIRILTLASDKPGLFNTMMLRHDCVHRNGFDKDGNELKVFTRTFVQDTADLLKMFVEAIERGVRARSAGET